MPASDTPNQVVAYNLRRARIRRDWTQEEAAEHLAPFLGERWSKAAYSAAERSVDGVRIRQFTADHLYAFARCFELPVSFFLAPTPVVETTIAPPNATETTSREQAFGLCFGLSEKAQEVLVGEILDRTMPATEMLAGWADNWRAASTKRERDLVGLFGEVAGQAIAQMHKEREAERGGD